MTHLGLRRIASMILLVLTLLAPEAATAQIPNFILMWGTFGNTSGQFESPFGVAVGANGSKVYVADSDNNRIQVFTADGAYLTQWGTMATLNYPLGVAVDASGDVYVALGYENRIKKFTSAGVPVASWGTTGSGNGQFSGLVALAVDASSDVFAVDLYNNRIQKFTSSGLYLTQWGTTGSGNGQFSSPTGVAVDAVGDVYVTDGQNNRVQKFTGDGLYLTQWGTTGSGSGQFSGPNAIAVDANGVVYVSDGSCRIQMFSGTGAYLGQWGKPGGSAYVKTPGGEFSSSAFGIAVDASGDVYVADRTNCRIQKFGLMPTPARAMTWGDLKRKFR